MAGLGTALPARPAKKTSTGEEGDPDFASELTEAQVLQAMSGNRAGLAMALQEKLDSLVGRSSGYIESLPMKIRDRVQALQTLQGEYDELEEKFQEEKAALEAKYAKLYDPLYSKRSDIVTGRVDVEHSAESEAEPAQEVEEEAEGEEGPDKTVGIPEFWLRAMKNHELLEEQITAKDEGPLKYLVDVKSDKDLGEDEKGFRLHFHFLPNPYFSNSILTKSYYMVDENDPILERAEGTEINWKAGKNVTVKVMKKKPKKGGKNAKPITKTEQCESFFNFFSPPTVPDDEEEIDEEEAERLQEVMEADYEMGATLREKVIPRAVAWFTGEAMMEEFDDEDEEEDDEGDDDEDEDEDDEDEESKPISGGTAPPAGEQPPECKQQ
eukprot:CAMPEP_0114253202 /NCGR_PEP_ID=MMETSP0058-20121206/16259_1 /TAXON_ID=36894 /ORGANISM="Pyramimonas parkeae, CCMP726" /LENGTH=381 /DNA_ID=CAMNT_0001367217 /DNA_START=72 /DNA_END=1217 /DNA_ORIENTATION=+